MSFVKSPLKRIKRIPVSTPTVILAEGESSNPGGEKRNMASISYFFCIWDYNNASLGEIKSIQRRQAEF